MRKSVLGSSWVAISALMLAACGGGGGDGGTVTPTPTPTNTPPTANAGTNQTVNSGVTVTLDGSASSDANGSIASYAWSQTAGTVVTLSSTSVARPTFTAPTVAAATTLTFSLTVTDNVGAASSASTVNVTVNPVGVGSVTGRVMFVRFPFSNDRRYGLDYGSPQQRPARGVTVRALAAGTQSVLASGTTDADGNYSLTVAGNTSVNVEVVAQMVRTGALPNWNFTVADLDVNTTPYTYNDGVAFNAGAGAHDIVIPSGFNASGGVTGTRASAPFAVLDTLYQGYQLVLGAAPNTNFPALVVDWAATNTPEEGTFFTAAPPQHIVLTADVTADTDEFDQHVIAHEFGHYIEHNFSRADNIGGQHGLGDKLDPRVAFGEGFGYAFGAMVLNDPVTRDSFVSDLFGCPNDRCSSTFDVELNPPTIQLGVNENYGCWCSESSVWSILWDVFDGAPDANDSLSLGFTPIWNVLVNDQRTSPAFTTIFTFVTALKARNGSSATGINTLVTAQNVNSAGIDNFATSETNFPASRIPSVAAIPIYATATVSGPQTVLRTVDDGANLAEGLGNKLGTHRFIRFTGTGNTVTITATSSSPVAERDVDFYVYRSAPFTLVSVAIDPPAPNETATFATANGDEYLIDVFECGNGCDPDPLNGPSGDYDLTVTIN